MCCIEAPCDQSLGWTSQPVPYSTAQFMNSPSQANLSPSHPGPHAAVRHSTDCRKEPQPFGHTGWQCGCALSAEARGAGVTITNLASITRLPHSIVGSPSSPSKRLERACDVNVEDLPWRPGWAQLIRVRSSWQAVPASGSTCGGGTGCSTAGEYRRTSCAGPKCEVV